MAHKKPVSIPVPTTAPEPRMLNVKQAAAYTGATVWQVRTWAWHRVVPFVKFGPRILFDKSDLDRHIESQKVRAAA
jgi:excisionase family DNA binding protein